MIKTVNAITCDAVSKQFYIVDDHLNWRLVFRDAKEPLNTFQALTDVSLIVPKGQFVGILGRNGAGKSTLLRVLGGVYTPTKGIVTASGEVSSLFEMGGFGGVRLTGYAYACRFLDFYGINNQDRSTLLENICQFSELDEKFYNPLYTYSSGMRARLYFATATELQHEIYLIDELLSVGDEHFQAKCWNRLRERFTHGASGVLVTHDWSSVLKLCQSAYILDKGTILNWGPSAAMVTSYLNLPKPTKEYAEIYINSSDLKCISGEDTDINMNILLKKDTPIALCYSIELFKVGYGWDVLLLHEDFVPIPCRLGLNAVQIRIEDYPLAPGTYILNLFLKSLSEDVDSIQLDGLSWTYGNGIELVVEGAPTLAATKLPWNVKITALNHATP
jgi:lipopolysaccharide transport system ATP-binding protein